jgi:pimeloyl-ACP methyl ester carboxylesterase
MKRMSLVLAVLVVPMALACTSIGHGGLVTTSPSHGPRAQLTQLHACAGIPGFTCSTLTVPLDHNGHTPGRLSLQVAAADNVKAPRGVLLFLTGGPGQPGVPFVPRIADRIAPVLKGYRLVMFDQRGTGQFGAINCPALQAAVGSSDITVPPQSAVQECANTIGPNRRFYSTADTVAEMEMLRQALGVRKMVVDGVSNGTFVAERYALAYPSHVSKLVLDSVLPQADRAVPMPSTWLGSALSGACYGPRARSSRCAGSTLHPMWRGWRVIGATAWRFSTCWSPTNSSIRRTATRTLHRYHRVSAM